MTSHPRKQHLSEYYFLISLMLFYEITFQKITSLIFPCVSCFPYWTYTSNPSQTHRSDSLTCTYTSINHNVIYIIYSFSQLITSWDSTVDITTGYGLDGRGVGVRVPVGERFFPFPRRPDQFWSPPSLLSNVCAGGSFPGGKAAGA
jgi:hypothetical protein